MTAGEAPAGGGFFHGRGHPHDVMPLPVGHPFLSLVIPAHAGIQGNDSLFWRCVNVLKKRHQCCWIQSFRKDDIPPPSRHALS